MNKYNIVVLPEQDGSRLDMCLAAHVPNMSRSKIQGLIKGGYVTLQRGSGQQPAGKLKPARDVHAVTHGHAAHPAEALGGGTDTCLGQISIYPLKTMPSQGGEVICSAKHKVAAGETYILTTAQPASEPRVEGYDLPLEVLYEDKYLAVINKPAGLVVHPGAGNYHSTLVNALVARYQSLSGLRGSELQGIVHRLDKNTSGVLVVAKEEHTHNLLSKQFALHTVERNYRALIYGVMPQPVGVIDNIIGRSLTNRQKMAVLSAEGSWLGRRGSSPTLNELASGFRGIPKLRGKRAITHYKTLAISEDRIFSLIDCSLETGRTHQIRVHLSNAQHPLVGDRVYSRGRTIKSSNFSGGKLELINSFISAGRQALHAYRLSFTHPITQERLTFVRKEDEVLTQLYKAIFEPSTLENIWQPPRPIKTLRNR